MLKKYILIYFSKRKSSISILNTCLFNSFSNKNTEINQEIFNLITNHPLFDKENFIPALFDSIRIQGIESFKQFFAFFDNDINIK